MQKSGIVKLREAPLQLSNSALFPCLHGHMVFRGLDRTSKTWTGLVKRGLVTRGLVKRGLIKRGLLKRRLVKRGLIKRGLVRQKLSLFQLLSVFIYKYRWHTCLCTYSDLLFYMFFFLLGRII